MHIYNLLAYTPAIVVLLVGTVIIMLRLLTECHHFFLSRHIKITTFLPKMWYNHQFTVNITLPFEEETLRKHFLYLVVCSACLVIRNSYHILLSISFSAVEWFDSLKKKSNKSSVCDIISAEQLFCQYTKTILCNQIFRDILSGVKKKYLKWNF